MSTLFQKIPPLTKIETNPLPRTMIRAFELYHSTVNDASYVSLGEERQSENHCIFHYTVQGHGEVICRGESYLTGAGEGFFNIINESGSGYRYPPASGEPWEFVVICFDGGNIREVVEEFLQYDVLYRADPETVCLLCNQLLENPGSALTFLPELVSALYHERRPVTKISAEFQSIVKRDLLKNPTISAIAAEMKMSREHLQRQYLKETGKTPRNYVNEKRFEQLCLYLTSRLSEERIAEIMHFSSVAEMRVMFKRYAGKTPRQYRNTGYFSV